jgi:hypothetical protein
MGVLFIPQMSMVSHAEKIIDRGLLKNSEENLY